MGRSVIDEQEVTSWWQVGQDNSKQPWQKKWPQGQAIAGSLKWSKQMTHCSGSSLTRPAITHFIIIVLGGEAIQSEDFKHVVFDRTKIKGCC